MVDNWTLPLVGLLALLPVGIYVADAGGWFVALTVLNVLIIVASLVYAIGGDTDASPA